MPHARFAIAARSWLIGAGSARAVSRCRRVALGAGACRRRRNAATATRRRRAQTEGPFFKPSSPERADLREPAIDGDGRSSCPGFVLTRALPAGGARAGRSLARRRQGRLRQRGLPLSRPPVHRRARAATASAPSCRRSIPAARGTITSRCRRRRPVLTTQLYFPDEPGNRARRPVPARTADARWRDGRRRRSPARVRFRARHALKRRVGDVGDGCRWRSRQPTEPSRTARRHFRCPGISSTATRARWPGGWPRPGRSGDRLRHPRRPGAGRDRRARTRRAADRDGLRRELSRLHDAGRAAGASRASRRRSSTRRRRAARAC